MRIPNEEGTTSEPKNKKVSSSYSTSSSSSESDSCSSANNHKSTRAKNTSKGRKGTYHHRRSSKADHTHYDANSFHGGFSRDQSRSRSASGRSSGCGGGGGRGRTDIDYEMDSSGNPSGVPISSISSGIGNDNPSFFTDEVFFAGGGGGENDEPPPPPPQLPPRKKGRRKKKFPPSPLPLYASPCKTSLSSRSPSSYNNETDFVDYEDFGPSSSSYEDDSTEESELALRTNKSSSLFYGNSSRESAREGMVKDSPWSRRASLYENKDEPCSSSSVRERLANLNNNYNTTTIGNDNHKKSTDISTNNNSLVKEIEEREDGAGGGGGGSEEPFTNVFVGVVEAAGGTTSDHQVGGESGHTSSNINRSNLKKTNSDKYKFSGVGRHFGRKKTLSLMDLLEDGSGVGGGGGGDTPDGSESSKGSFLSKVDVLGWATRLKAFSIIFLASTFILSTASLLFVFPIIIDPILLGLDAHFSNSSVLCRTSNIRNGSGSAECSMQSCREGCTADIFQCTFIDVEYFPSLQLPSSSFIASNTSYVDLINSLNTSSDASMNDVDSSEIRRVNGTLFININGCGYPPSVNCSEFREKYGKVGTTFLCHYSQSNASIVVPNYSVSQQKRYLFLAFVIPIGLSVGSALSLFILLKCRWTCSRRGMGNIKGPGVSSNRDLDKTPTKLFETAEGLEEKLRGDNKDSPGGESNRRKKKKEPLGGGTHAKANGISSTGQNHLKNHSEMNGVVIGGDFHNGSSKANGFALPNTISGLMGMSSPHKIHESIKTLPHQHDSFEGNVSILNGFAAFGIDQPETNHYNRSAVKRKPLYAKNNPNRNKLFHANSIDETRRLPNEELSHRSSNGIHSTSSNSNPPNNGNANRDSRHRNNHKEMAEDKL